MISNGSVGCYRGSTVLTILGALVASALALDRVDAGLISPDVPLGTCSSDTMVAAWPTARTHPVCPRSVTFAFGVADCLHRVLPPLIWPAYVTDADRVCSQMPMLPAWVTARRSFACHLSFDNVVRMLLP